MSDLRSARDAGNLELTRGRGLMGEVGEELLSPPVLSRDGLGTCDNITMREMCCHTQYCDTIPDCHGDYKQILAKVREEALRWEHAAEAHQSVSGSWRSNGCWVP